MNAVLAGPGAIVSKYPQWEDTEVLNALNQHINTARVEMLHGHKLTPEQVELPDFVPLKITINNIVSTSSDVTISAMSRQCARHMPLEPVGTACATPVMHRSQFESCNMRALGNRPGRPHDRMSAMHFRSYGKAVELGSSSTASTMEVLREQSLALSKILGRPIQPVDVHLHNNVASTMVPYNIDVQALANWCGWDAMPAGTSKAVRGRATRQEKSFPGARIVLTEDSNARLLAFEQGYLIASGFRNPRQATHLLDGAARKFMPYFRKGMSPLRIGLGLQQAHRAFDRESRTGSAFAVDDLDVLEVLEKLRQHSSAPLPPMTHMSAQVSNAIVL